MDTERATSGFTRSVVMKTGLASRDVLAGAAGSPHDGNATTSSAGIESLIPLAPTLIGTNLVLSTPDIKRLPSAGTKGHVDVAFKIKDRKALPTGLQASVRWDPIDVAVAPADPANEVGPAAAPAAVAGSETPTPSATPKPAAAPAAEASAAPAKTSKPSKTAKPAPSPKAQAAKPKADASATPVVEPAKANDDATVAAQQATGSAEPSAVTDTSTTPASAEASPGASPEASPSGSAAPDAEGPLVALPADNPASDGGPAGSDVLAAPPVEEADVTPRLGIPADELDLVVPERIGDVVAPAPVAIGKKSLSIPVSMPSVPGKYRLTITLHDKDGVVYDAATQALIPSLIVRVTGDFDGAILATPTANLTAGRKAELDVRAINLGLTAWGHDAIATATDLIGGGAPAQGADVVGRWVPLSYGAALPTDPADQSVKTELPIGLQPGVKVDTVL